ncbi:3-oxoacyl-[acyl-carrier-protein] synthase III C-terminal domain-containing protein [Sorangium sp. So ce296]|uniref:3-oxoacyl-ACP synthase III family protein n=1 Tax=Sorangium sp. So ce296 TaxID=3133296 RepID=UPI003F5E1BAF
MPSEIRTNDYWRERFPRVREAEERQRRKRASSGQEATKRLLPSHRLIIDAEMAPYLDDPFHGAVERRVLGPGQSTTTLALAAARQAIEAASLSPRDIDLVMATSMFPDRVGSGDAGFIARELGHEGGAFNVEATCSGSLVAFLIACALVQSGRNENVLVVATCNFSRAIDDAEATSMLCGDGAGAFVVGRAAPGEGLLGSKSVHTGETCGTWLMDTAPDPTGTTAGGRKIRLRVDESIAHVLRTTAEPYLLKACRGALKAAKVDIDDVALFVVNTPTAWHASFSARALKIDPERIVDTFPLYGNIGPALMPVNLHHGARTRRLRRGDLVLLYTFGGQAEATAAVIRWGDVRLGGAALPRAEQPAT